MWRDFDGVEWKSRAGDQFDEWIWREMNRTADDDIQHDRCAATG